MSAEDKESNPKSSLEERIKSNVALWFLGAVATGFAAGIAAVKWSDERYKVEPIPIAERDALLKARSDLVALRGAYNELKSKNAELKEVVSKRNPTLEPPRNGVVGQPVPAACISERSELQSLKDSYAKSQADLTAALKSCGSAGRCRDRLAHLRIVRDLYHVELRQETGCRCQHDLQQARSRLQGSTTRCLHGGVQSQRADRLRL
jgi:hypothetical protein